MRKAVKKAFDLIVAGEKQMIRELPRAAADGSPEDIWSSSFVMSGAYLSRVDSSKLASLCSRANTNLGSRNKARRKIKKRIKFYAGLDGAGMQRYVVAQSGRHACRAGTRAPYGPSSALDLRHFHGTPLSSISGLMQRIDHVALHTRRYSCSPGI